MNSLIIDFTALILIFIALLHVYWGLGGLWPGKDKQNLIDKVFGRGNQFPSPFSCYLVAVALLISTASLLLGANLIPPFNLEIPVIWINRFVAFVFFARGTGGYLPFMAKRSHPLFLYYTRRVYNPLCLFLAYVFAML